MSIRIFKTRWFAKWAKKISLSDVSLVQAVREMENGLVDAHLGGFLYKKGVAIRGRGKRGSLRTVLAYKHGDKIFFMFGFAKNEKADLENVEKLVCRKWGLELLSYSDRQLEVAKRRGEIMGVEYETDKVT